MTTGQSRFTTEQILSFTFVIIMVNITVELCERCRRGSRRWKVAVTRCVLCSTRSRVCRWRLAPETPSTLSTNWTDSATAWTPCSPRQPYDRCARVLFCRQFRHHAEGKRYSQICGVSVHLRRECPFALKNDWRSPLCPNWLQRNCSWGRYSRNTTWLVMSRRDTTRRVRRSMGYMACRVVTWRAKWNLGL